MSIAQVDSTSRSVRGHLPSRIMKSGYATREDKRLDRNRIEVVGELISQTGSDLTGDQSFLIRTRNGDVRLYL